MPHYFDSAQQRDILALSRTFTVRTQWPTLLLLIAVPCAWLVLLLGSSVIGSTWRIVLLIPVVVLWMSVQHELLHGRPTPNKGVNKVLGYAPFALWCPYTSYRDSHLLHHRDHDLTLPGFDPESRYLSRKEWPDSSVGAHCSVIVSRESDPRRALSDFKNSRGVINDLHSNSGMNLFRLKLAPLQQDGRFFASVAVSGAHRQSLRRVRDGWADLASIDSVTFAYLARYAPAEIAQLRIVTRTASAPTLPYITALSAGSESAERIREVMNHALQQLPRVSEILGLIEVLPAVEDYMIVLAYQLKAAQQGYPALK